MKTKKFFIILVLLFLIQIPNYNYAVLQANPNTHGATKYTPTNWMLYVRQMETKNQAMGLNETLNETSMKATSSTNNLDVHMIKTTEYGAIAILSASGYGNSKKIQETDPKTTTGNKSGIYFNQAWEWTAGGLSGSIFLDATNKKCYVDSKYYNAYGADYTSAKAGDGLGSTAATDSKLKGCAMWHSASYADWVYSSNPYFERGDTSVFLASETTTLPSERLGRAVVVCGENF